MSVKFDLVDPNLASGGEDQPDYQVSFWTWRDEGWQEQWITIQEADADEVLEWATANAEGRHFTIWARSVLMRADGRLDSFDIRLVRTEPTADDSTYPPWTRRHTSEQGPPSPRNTGVSSDFLPTE